jgi:uncharacterized protein YbjT (DUF2867 family)
MNLFLTGATGFLGRYVLRELLVRGHRVWALFRDIQRRDRTVAFLQSHGLSGKPDTLQGRLETAMKEESHARAL